MRLRILLLASFTTMMMWNTAMAGKKKNKKLMPPQRVERRALNLADFVSLNHHQSALRLVVYYPGPAISGLCGITLRMNRVARKKHWESFLKKIQLKRTKAPYQVVWKGRRGMMLQFGIGGFQTYLTDITFRTKTGKSLHDTIQSLFPRRKSKRFPRKRQRTVQIIATGIPCKNAKRGPAHRSKFLSNKKPASPKK
mgnify:CR=1 FL=1